MAITKLFYIGSELSAPPPFARRFFIDSTNKRAYLSLGTSAASDWKELQQVQHTAVTTAVDTTLTADDNGKIIVLSGTHVDVTLPASSTLVVGWKVTLANENASSTQANNVSPHTTTAASTPIGRYNILVKRAGTDTVARVSTQFNGVALVIPPRTVVDIWYTSSGRFEAAASSTVGWKDMPVAPYSPGLAAKDPNLTTIGSSFMKGWEFTDANAGAEKEIYYSIHVNHDIVAGTKIYPHVHWNSGNTTATSVVGWTWTYDAVKGHGQQAMSVTGTTISAATTLNGTAYTHYVTETSDANAIPATNIEPDTIIYFKLIRDSANANGTGDSLAASVWLTFVDAHYLSTDGGTPLKIPPFYL
jgi:hypothetical protein